MKLTNLQYLGYKNDHAVWVAKFPIPFKWMPFNYGSAVVIVSEGVSEYQGKKFKVGTIYRLVETDDGGIDLDRDVDLDSLTDQIHDEFEKQNPSSIEKAVRVIEEFLSRA